MEKFKLELKTGMVNVYRYGTGQNLLIALHGFADEGKSFTSFESNLGQHYTILAPDLPYHGETDFGARYFTKEDILSLIKDLLKHENKKTFDLLGHSMGAEIALALSPILKGQLVRLFLLAPGGIGVKGMSIPNLIPLTLKDWVAKWLEQPAWIFAIANFLVKLKILDAYSLKFLKHHLGDTKRRKRLMNTWISQSHLNIDRGGIRTMLDDKLRLEVILGESDKIIDEQSVRSWLRGMPNSKVHLLKGGHKIINSNCAKLIQSIIA